MLAGEDPRQIERLWHKVFRGFTYMGSRGAAVECVSAIDIALWDIRGKVLGQPIYELLGGPVRDEISLYTHPDQSKFTSKEGVVAEIRDIVDSGHTALKFDPFPYQGPSGGDGLPREQRDGYLDGSMTRRDEREAAELTALIRETAGPDVDILIDAHGRFDVPTAIRLCRTLEEAGEIDWFEEPVPPESYNALKQVREKVSAAISVGERGHTKWDFVPILENKLADYIMPDVTWTGGITELKKISSLCRGLLRPDLAARCERPDQRRRRRPGDDDGAELLPAGDLALGSQQLQRLHPHAARQFKRRPSSFPALPASASR